MSGSQFQLTPPFSAFGAGYRPHWQLGPQLTLDPSFTSSMPGWSVKTGTGQVFNLWPTGLGSTDFNLGNKLGGWSASLGPNPTSQQLKVPSLLQSLGINDWDDIYGLARKLGISTWADIPSSKMNIVTHQPAAGGKLDPSGLAIPSSPDDAISGFAIPSPAFSAGKRFGFSSSLDVHLYLYADKDALLHDQKFLFSGGGVGFETKTGSGTPLKLQLGAGRDPSGGAGGFINLQIGPDFVAMPPMSGRP